MLSILLPYIQYLMQPSKESSIWLIPFSIDEVKVWDILILKSWRREVIEKIVSKVKLQILIKRLNKNFRSWMEMWTDWKWTYIDRRSRYKRILDSLSELIPSQK